MNLLARLGRARIAAEVRAVLGGALAGATAGAVVAALGAWRANTPASGEGGLALLASIAAGFGLGWWMGLAGSILLAIHARRRTPPPPVAALGRAAWGIAAAAAVTALAAAALGQPVTWGVGAGLATGAMVALVILHRAQQRPTR